MDPLHESTGLEPSSETEVPISELLSEEKRVVAEMEAKGWSYIGITETGIALFVRGDWRD